jgi:hypothetical protein
MSIQHTVEQGDCLSAIAERYGYYWQTLWDFFSVYLRPVQGLLDDKNPCRMFVAETDEAPL